MDMPNPMFSDAEDNGNAFNQFIAGLDQLFAHPEATISNRSTVLEENPSVTHHQASHPPHLAEPDHTTISNRSTVLEENPSVTHHQASHPLHLAEPDHTGPNKHVVGTGSGQGMNHGLKNSGKKRQYQSSTMEGALTAGMVNAHNWPPYMNPNQQAGSSQPSNEGNKADPKKSAKQRSDAKYRANQKQKVIDLERGMDGLSGRNKFLEHENASLKKDKRRLEKDLNQYQKMVSQLNDFICGQNANVAVLSKAYAESNNVDVLHEKEQLKRENSLLIKQINNPTTVDMIQLQAKNAQLESEVSLLRRLVIDALCKTMKTDVKDDE